MKKIVVLAVILSLSQALTALAGPEVSSKEVVPPPAPPPPPEYFRPNEFDIGAFGSYAEGVGSGGHHLHGWGGGMDFTYWFPWKYAGVRFQGAGFDVSGGGGPRSRTFTFPDGETATISGGGGSVSAGVVTGEFSWWQPMPRACRRRTRISLYSQYRDFRRNCLCHPKSVKQQLYTGQFRPQIRLLSKKSSSKVTGGAPLCSASGFIENAAESIDGVIEPRWRVPNGGRSMRRRLICSYCQRNKVAVIES